MYFRVQRQIDPIFYRIDSFWFNVLYLGGEPKMIRFLGQEKVRKYCIFIPEYICNSVVNCWRRALVLNTDKVISIYILTQRSNFFRNKSADKYRLQTQMWGREKKIQFWFILAIGAKNIIFFLWKSGRQIYEWEAGLTYFDSFIANELKFCARLLVLEQWKNENL